MSDQLKILGQLDAAATTIETLYTTPDLVMTTVSSLVVCNRTAASITFRVSIYQAGSSPDDKQFIFYDAPLAANSTLTTVIGITLTEGDLVKTYASAIGMSFNLYGVETSR